MHENTNVPLKWTVPSYLLAKKKQLSFYEGLRPIAALIKDGLLLLRSTIVLVVLKNVKDALANVCKSFSFSSD